MAKAGAAAKRRDKRKAAKEVAKVQPHGIAQPAAAANPHALARDRSCAPRPRKPKFCKNLPPRAHKRYLSALLECPPGFGPKQSRTRDVSLLCALTKAKAHCPERPSKDSW
jgi:hypothetical protein